MHVKYVSKVKKAQEERTLVQDLVALLETTSIFGFSLGAKPKDVTALADE